MTPESSRNDSAAAHALSDSPIEHARRQGRLLRVDAGALDLLDLLGLRRTRLTPSERNGSRFHDTGWCEVIGGQVRSESVPVSRSVSTRPLRFAVATPWPL